MTSKKRSAFREAAAAKGWRLNEIAQRWGILPRQMSRISTDPKQRDWDALAGLPRKPRDER